MILADLYFASATLTSKTESLPCVFFVMALGIDINLDHKKMENNDQTTKSLLEYILEIDALSTMEFCVEIFKNPRKHTGKGYYTKK
jgi:hypothetical protein